MATISGTLKNASGVRPNTKIILTAYKTTSDVVTLAPDTTIITNANGAYSFVCNPSFYNVRIQQTGHPCENVGIIQVYSDSVDGTINDFLTVFKPDDLTPEILKQCIAAMEGAETAQKAAEEAAANAADEYSQIFQNRFNLLRPIPWTANTQIEVKQQLQVFEYEKLFYLPDPKQLPFNTGSTFDNSQFTLSELVTAHQMRTDSASQLGGVYEKDYATGDVIPPDAMKNKLTYWHDGQFYSVGTDTGFTSNDFVSDLVAGRFVSAEIATNNSVYTLNRSIYKYRDLASNNDWTAAFRQALLDNDTVDIGDLNCRVTELSIEVGKTITTNGSANILLDNCSANITFTDLAETRVTTALSSFSDILTVPDANLFKVGDWILIRFYPDSASGEAPVIERSLDLDDWGYQSQLTKIVAISGTQVTIQDRTFCEMIANQGCYITTNPKVDTNIDGNITFTRNSQKSMFVLQSRTKFNKTKFHGSGGLDNIISMNGKSLCSFTDIDFDGFHGGGGVVQCSYGACFNTFTRCTLTDCDGTDGGVIMFYGSNNNTVDTMYSLSNDPIQHYYGGVVITAKSWGNTVIGSKFVGGSTGMALLFGAFDNHIIGCSFSAQKYSHVHLNLVDGNSFGFCNFESSNTESYFYQVYAAASKNVDFTNCKFRGKGLLVSALTWKSDSTYLTSTCCFTFTACEFINSRIYMSKSASKLSFDNCEFSCTPDVGYQCVIKTFKINVNQTFTGWVIKNTSFVNAFICLDGMSFSRIIGNDFDGINNTVSDTAIDITTTSACTEIIGNTFKNYKSITTLNSLESSTTKMFDNIAINVSNKDNAVGAYALDGTAKPNPNFACPANWIVYPHTRDASQIRTIESWRSKGNGFTSDAQFVKVMINEEN